MTSHAPSGFAGRGPRIGTRALLVAPLLLLPLRDLRSPAEPPGFTPAAGRVVAVGDGGASKVCQVVGEFDRHAGRPTVNATESRYGFWGTDLGASFEHGGRLYVLFGDTHPSGGLARPRDSDAIAVSDDATPEDCLHLSFLTDGDGGFRPLHIPGVYAGAFAVPTGGFSIDGRIYVLATSDVPGRGPMGRSVLARSDDDGRTFRYLYDVSVDRLNHVAPAMVPAGGVPGLPGHAGDGILLWGSGDHRRSNPHLAFIPADAVEDRTALRHFAGIDPGTGRPLWSPDERAGVPLFDQPCVGELSAGWNPYLGKWTLLYTCGGRPTRILLRTADFPWGPWSEPAVLFDPARVGEACAFLNPLPQPAVILAGGRPCPTVADAHNPLDLGDSYGAYLIPRFTTGEAGRSSTIHFLMSTWNPYTVVLMKATLRLHDGDRFASVALDGGARPHDEPSREPKR